MGKLNKETVEAVFRTSSNQSDAVEYLYRLLFPDYDRIKKINGHPKVGKDLSKLIWDLFISFDKEHHPNAMAGGAWLNWGFSTDYTLDPWGYSIEGLEVVYEKA
jgi:hypothetical protein